MLSTLLIAAAVAVTGAMAVAAGGSQEPERPRNTPSLSSLAPPVTPGVPEQTPAVQDRRSELVMRALEAMLKAQKALVTAQPTPRIVCGMKMIEVDPNTDPKILLPPAASDVDPKIRTSSPAACRE